jgi:hypothetical protein
MPGDPPTVAASRDSLRSRVGELVDLLGRIGRVSIRPAANAVGMAVGSKGLVVFSMFSRIPYGGISGVRHPNSGLPEFGKHQRPIRQWSGRMARASGARRTVNDGIFQIADISNRYGENQRGSGPARCSSTMERHFGVADT